MIASKAKARQLRHRLTDEETRQLAVESARRGVSLEVFATDALRHALNRARVWNRKKGK